MATKKPKTVLYRRKREQKTNYQRRLKLLLSGKPRLVVRFTNSKIIAQIIEFTTSGDKVLAAVDAFALKKLGWNYSCKNIPAAYLTGLLLSKTAQEKNCKEVILDTGLKTALGKSRIYAFLKGVLDAGLTVPYGNEKIFPNEERLSGKHITDFASQLKGNKELYERNFSRYLKSNSLPEQIAEDFKMIKQKIMV